LRVSEYYREHAADIQQQGEQLKRAFESMSPPAPAGPVALDRAPLEAARAALEQSFDERYGGFGRAPKFPHPASIERSLRQWYATSASKEVDLKALFMATLTLTRMAEGGIADQLGGGFSRYSVDDFWMIPHFEKMLYDNALLLGEYARAGSATGETLFLNVAGATADWVLRDMRSPEGGFYSSLDADSEGHEGKFYVWSRADVQALLSAPEYAVFARRFGLDRDANFEGEWHLHCYESMQSDPHNLLDSARGKLLAVRNARIWPGRDDKVLTAWNALMIKGLAIASRVLGRTDLAEAAFRCADFLRDNLWRDGRLLATYKEGRAHLAAYLDDYAFLADALLELLQTRWRSSDLRFAQSLVEVLLDKFEDAQHGGFFFTAADHEQLIHRSKTFSDDSLPSGNAVAVSVLCRLGHLLGETRYLDAAERTLQCAWPLLSQYPQAHMSLVNSLEDYLAELQILIIRGPSAQAAAWARQLGAEYAPLRMIFAIPGDAADLPPALAEKRATDATVAYLCNGMICSAPLYDLQAICAAMRRLSSPNDSSP
jgi:hypothetical protein